MMKLKVKALILVIIMIIIIIFNNYYYSISIHNITKHFYSKVPYVLNYYYTKALGAYKSWVLLFMYS